MDRSEYPKLPSEWQKEEGYWKSVQQDSNNVSPHFLFDIILIDKKIQSSMSNLSKFFVIIYLQG